MPFCTNISTRCSKWSEHGGFDVLAHIDYPLRVMKYDGYTPSFDHFMDRVEQVLRSCIDRGYALELNAAGLGGWQKRVGPPQNVLYEYRRMGGERISIGSDAHTLAAVGRGFDDSVRNAQRRRLHSCYRVPGEKAAFRAAWLRKREKGAKIS